MTCVFRSLSSYVFSKALVEPIGPNGARVNLKLHFDPRKSPDLMPIAVVGYIARPRFRAVETWEWRLAPKSVDRQNF